MKKTENEIPGIGLIGMSHKTADVGTREAFSLGEENVCAMLKKIQTDETTEAVCISTCNRVEIYFASTDIQKSVETIIRYLEDISSMKREAFEKNIYKKYSRDAIQHLLTVASSLDSMVVGENEILGQVKDAYRLSTNEKRTGQILNRLFHQAFKSAKRVRTETEISKNPLSVAYIATELAKSIFEDLSRRKALLIGAGEMGELILKYLTKYSIGGIMIANRSFHNADRIAAEINVKSQIITLEDVREKAVDADIIISSVHAPAFIISQETAAGLIKRRKNRPVFIIDIAVPRSIDPGAGNLDNIFLYNIDDLKSIADENLKSRLREVELAKQLIESDVEEFFEWYEGLCVVPAIIKIQDKFNEIRHSELSKYRSKKLKHITEKDFKHIEDLTMQIMTKTLHNPIIYLKEYQTCEEKEKKKIREIAKIIENIFGKKS